MKSMEVIFWKSKSKEKTKRQDSLWEICNPYVLTKQKSQPQTRLGFRCYRNNNANLLHLVDDGLESLGVVEGEVGKDLAVDLDTRLGELVHELAVVHAILTDGSIDTDNPQTAEFALLVSSVAISVGLTLFVRVLRHSPDILSRAELTLGLLQDFLSSGS